MVSESLSSTEGSGGSSATAPLSTYTEKFNELFPHYLSFGMTEEQYWDKDCTLVAAYRKAEELRMNRRNQEMWLQGAYFYALTEKQIELREEEHAKGVYDKGKKLMEGFMASHNKKFEGK